MALTATHGKRSRHNVKSATYHITTRCNNKLHLIKNPLDFRRYIYILKKSKEKYGFLLHNYSMVNSHTHLILRLENIINLSQIMHSINRWYAAWYNTKYGRTGHFWEERFYAELIQDDLQLLTAMIYADLNPVKAGLCKHPADWKFSGACHYINGNPNTLINIPDAYLNLGENKTLRSKTYTRIMKSCYKRLVGSNCPK
ncbi:MAG: transposase [Candidatus Omnitrophota bacterium]